MAALGHRVLFTLYYGRSRLQWQHNNAMAALGHRVFFILYYGRSRPMAALGHNGNITMLWPLSATACFFYFLLWPLSATTANNNAMAALGHRVFFSDVLFYFIYFSFFFL